MASVSEFFADISIIRHNSGPPSDEDTPFHSVRQACLDSTWRSCQADPADLSAWYS